MPRPATPATTFVSHSPETGTNYPLYIEAPDPARERGPWPAVLLMDGDYFFAPAVEAYRKLRAGGNVPPLLIAGVGYGATFGQPGNHRSRDYTPTFCREEPASGGADAFLKYLSETLWPELADRYPLREKGRALAGYSLGALFVLHALFQSHPFFSHALAGAPSIWWDDRSLLRSVARLREHEPVLDGRLFFGVGAKDSPSMLGDLKLLERQLAERPFERLEIASKRFAGRDHYNAAPDCFRAGLRAITA